MSRLHTPIRKNDTVSVNTGKDSGKRGRVLFEMEGISEASAREAMKLAAAKLSILTKFAMRFEQEKML